MSERHFVYSNVFAAGHAPAGHMNLDVLELSHEHAEPFRTLLAQRPKAEGEDKQAWNAKMRSFLKGLANGGKWKPGVKMTTYLVPRDVAENHPAWMELDRNQIATIQERSYKRNA